MVQARSLLEKGALGVPDLPLVFTLHAALAKLFGAMMEQSAAIVLAVKLTDATLPALAAWPVYRVAARWCSEQKRGDGIALAAAAFVSLGGQLLISVGDFQKQSLALLWLAALLAALASWLEEHSARRGLAVLLFLALAGLTHIGVFGSALLLTALTLGAFALRKKAALRPLLPWLGAAALTALLVALVLMKFDAARLHRLAGAFFNPAGFFGDDGGMKGPPGGAFKALSWIAAALFALPALPALIIAWRRRESLNAADFAVVTGCALTTLALTGPWMSLDKEMRFAMIAVAPAALSGAFALTHLKHKAARRTLAGFAVLVACGPALPLVWMGGAPALDSTALRELAALRKYVPQPERTLIVASHGVEWWTAWLLHTHIAQTRVVRAAHWQRYATVLFLHNKTPILPPGMPRGGRGGFLGPMPPAMMAVPIPSDADILHDGVSFTLARVRQPPAFVTENQAPR